MDDILSKIKRQACRKVIDNQPTLWKNNSHRKRTNAGDFDGCLVKKKLMHLGHISFQSQNLHVTEEESPESSEPYVESVTFNGNNSVVFVKLVKANILRNVLQHVLLGGSFTASSSEKAFVPRSLLLLHPDPDISSISNFRNILVLRALQACTKVFKHNVCSLVLRESDVVGDFQCLFNSLDSLMDSQMGRPPVEACLVWNRITPDIKEFLNNLSTSQYFFQNSSQEVAEINIDIEKYCHDLNVTGYVSSISSQELLQSSSAETSRICSTAAAISSAFNLIPNSDRQAETHLIHLVSVKKMHQAQSAAFVCDMGTRGKYNNAGIVNRFCSYKPENSPLDLVSSSVKGMFDRRVEELRLSYRLKYGDQVGSLEWDKLIMNVAVASLKLDIFACPLSANFKEEVPENGDVSSRSSLFILYNYSRLSKILERFNEKVADGTYQSIPPITEVDFSLLNNGNEWNLCLRYILWYPVVLKDIYSQAFLDEQQKLCKNISISKLVQFLSNLSRDWSSYYHQTKVLLDPQPHLFPLMCSRIYFVMAIKKIMDSCFSILGVKPPKQM